ncbi:hypothetical protein K3495_g3673 [Podosphaera aphanis]|nr:hypothetical protein K3495_g3673 [Podosphaera aphanis]
MTVLGSNRLYEIQEPNLSALSGIPAVAPVLDERISSMPDNIENQLEESVTESIQNTPSSHENVRSIPNDKSLWELYHCRLGHVKFRDVKKLADQGVIPGKLTDKKPAYYGERQCESCLAGRMKEHSNKKTETREHIKGRRLHADISGI